MKTSFKIYVFFLHDAACCNVYNMNEWRRLSFDLIDQGAPPSPASSCQVHGPVQVNRTLSLPSFISNRKRQLQRIRMFDMFRQSNKLCNISSNRELLTNSSASSFLDFFIVCILFDIFTALLCASKKLFAISAIKIC